MHLLPCFHFSNTAIDHDNFKINSKTLTQLASCKGKHVLICTSDTGTPCKYNVNCNRNYQWSLTHSSWFQGLINLGSSHIGYDEQKLFIEQLVLRLDESHHLSETISNTGDKQGSDDEKTSFASSLARGVNVNAVSFKHPDITPLIAAVKVSNKQIVRQLLENGADTETLKMKGKNTPLHYAVLAASDDCSKDNFEIIDILLKFHAKIDWRGENGMTPLRLAEIKNHTKAQQKLLPIQTGKVFIPPNAPHISMAPKVYRDEKRELRLIKYRSDTIKEEDALLAEKHLNDTPEVTNIMFGFQKVKLSHCLSQESFEVLTELESIEQPIYLALAKNNWALTESQQFTLESSYTYSIELNLKAGELLEFKITSQDGKSLNFRLPNGVTFQDNQCIKFKQVDDGRNAKIVISDGGKYKFTVDNYMSSDKSVSVLLEKLSD